MSFQVVPDARSITAKITEPFVLKQNNWDDYGYKTTYVLYHSIDVTEPELIGSVKILRREQSTGYTYEIELGTFESLADDFCSVGSDLDYYERLVRLPEKYRNMVLTGLRDIIADPNIRTAFRSNTGYSKSLFRDTSENSDDYVLAEAMLRGNYDSLPSTTLEMSFHPVGWDNPLEFSFDAPALPPQKNDVFAPKPSPLPRRVAVLIGRNGSGKSTLLSRFARVAYASPTNRVQDPWLKQIGTLNPPGLGFNRIITVSYSAFDSFQIPGVTTSEREKIATDLNRGAGRFVFCGLRDIVEELTREAQGSEAPTDAFHSDRSNTTLLKPVEKLAEEFERLVKQIDVESKRELFSDALTPLLAEPSFGESDTDSFINQLHENARAIFLRWSTGHKIVMHIVTSIVAHAAPKSIVLFDEPESHLHPPLLAALMHAVRVVLNAKDSFAIVATHSPVILQETLARHARVVTRVGDRTRIDTPTVETFGENVGALTYEVFQLTGGSTDFHTVLDRLVEIFGSVDAIETLFEKGMSAQARAYVMSRYATRLSEDNA